MVNQIEGQLSLWDVEHLINKDIKPEGEITKVENENLFSKLDISERQENFLEKNKVWDNDNLTRVTQICSGGLLVEFKYSDKYKTVFLNKEGVIEHSYDKKISITPTDKIIFYKNDIELNEIQSKKLFELKEKGLKVIKRKGDESLIAIDKDKVISVTTQGWVLEYKEVQAIFNDEDVITNIQSDEEMLENINVGAYVFIEVGDEIYKGIVTRIYNNGDTVNCIYNNKHSAFHKSKVRKINLM